ncbi:hypothetical protein C7M84_008976 [Penaeus vannamei]|uniref:Saposin B-type domain-containing protein n=1 Tax=Penaeus vannamei TaxID=6689 RepID=A0A3R7M4F5_PENVA|nr:hypothetical protein C7M84_008976 [Penaeus vannamei]
MAKTASFVLLLFAYATALPQPPSLGGFPQDDLQREMSTALRTGDTGPLLKEVIRRLDLRHLLASERLPDAHRSSLLCSTCSVGVAQIIQEVENGAAPEAIAGQLTDLCVALGVATLNVCQHFFALAEVGPGGCGRGQALLPLGANLSLF